MLHTPFFLGVGQYFGFKRIKYHIFSTCLYLIDDYILWEYIPTNKTIVKTMTVNLEQETYDNLRTKWLNTADEIEALSYLKDIGDFKTDHPGVMDKKVNFI